MPMLKDLSDKCRALVPFKQKSKPDALHQPLREKTDTPIVSRKGDDCVLYDKDENKERGNWSGRLDFLLSMLGWSVGLGNVWRFPYLCYRNGGGVFLIPYLLTLAVVGVPMFFLEINMAQFSSLGTLNCWQFAPIFKGLGLGMMLVTFLTTLYYNVIISYCLIYLVSSFTSYLPWTDCDNEWNTPGCSHKLPLVNCTAIDGLSYPNGTCYNETSFVGLWNISRYENDTGISRMSPSEEYFNFNVLGISTGIEDFGTLQWKVTVAFLCAWLLVFLCICKGVKSSGKVVYVTATFPYIVLTILLIRSLLLDGSVDGIQYYITPKWEKLADGKVWRDGATQIFYSMGMGWGGLQALASYNKFHNNSLRDSLVVTIGCCFTSIFAGFVVFAFLGAMAHNMETDIDSVIQNGPGLVFIVYPEAFTYMPLPTLWSILFFIMILTIGLDSQFVMVETVITCVLDEFPFLRSKKTLVILCICIAKFFIGLPITSSAGIYILLLIDNFASWVGLPILVFLECVAIAYVYGADRFMNDIKVMLGERPSIYFKICWFLFVPLLIPFVLIYPFLNYSRFSYGDSYIYPVWGEALGWIFTISPLLSACAYTIYMLAKMPGRSLLQKIKVLLKPSREWGPYLIQHRMLVDYVDNFVVDVRSDCAVKLTEFA